MMLMTVCLA